MSTDLIIIYATNWCGDCKRARRFFDDHEIPYQWINIDSNPEANNLSAQPIMEIAVCRQLSSRMEEFW